MFSLFPHKTNIQEEARFKLNEKLQELIIKQLGYIGVIALIGTIVITCLFPDKNIAITVLFGAVSGVIGALSAFLNSKTPTEKENEILTQNLRNDVPLVEDEGDVQ